MSLDFRQPVSSRMVVERDGQEAEVFISGTYIPGTARTWDEPPEYPTVEDVTAHVWRGGRYVEVSLTNEELEEASVRLMEVAW